MCFLQIHRCRSLFFWVFTIAVLLNLWGCADQGTRFSFDRVKTQNPQSVINANQLFDLVLERYVDENSLVGYADWLNQSEDVDHLKKILADIENKDVSGFSENEKKTFYINAYNAITLDLIVSNYEKTQGNDTSPFPNVRSIMNIEDLGGEIWGEFSKRGVAGLSYSLNDIEHQLLRPLGDARIHFAINCASIGCPPLLNRGFREESLDEDLEALAIRFVNSGERTHFDHDNKIIKTSKILEWFQEDFIKHFGSLREFFKKYVTVISLNAVDAYDIQFLEYDWTLNESKE